MFQTPPGPGAGDAASIWVIARHDTDASEVEMFKVTPELTVGKLQISLSARDEVRTDVTIAYEFTSLGPLGDAYLEGFTAQWYEQFKVEPRRSGVLNISGFRVFRVEYPTGSQSGKCKCW